MWVVRVLATVLVFEVAIASSAIKLNGNGYENVVVGISDMIPEPGDSSLIDAIKTTLTEASRILFAATHQKVYFKDIKILLPKSWTNTQSDESAMSERFVASDIRIDQPDGTYDHQPFTLHTGLCGDPGLYIHLTPDYMTNDFLGSWWGPRAKVMVKEWARFRWGVYDEMGYEDDNLHPLFYEIDTDNDGVNELKPNYCTYKEVTGSVLFKDNRGKCTANDNPEQKCLFDPDLDQNVTSSLMSNLVLENVVEFCDQHTHNRDAKTRQNLMCNDRSAWEVMLKNADFNRLTSAPPGTDVTPKFTLIKEEEPNFALVLDYSGSMSGDRITKLWRESRRWILHDVAVGSSVGIVHFSDAGTIEAAATVEAPMTKITDTRSRNTLISAITTSVGGGTCIGCGLRKAVNELLRNKHNKVILLLSDGQDGSTLKISAVMDEVIKSGAQVQTIAFGNAADVHMEELAQKTGGKSYTVADTDDGTMMANAFQGALTYQPGNTLINTNMKILEEEYPGTKTTEKGSFIVDATLGRNLQFRLISNSQAHVKSNPVLTSPSGIQHTKVDFDSTTILWTIDVASAETGTWQWSVTLSGSTGNNIRVSVTAQAKDPETLPISTNSWVNVGANSVDASKQNVMVYARVTQGENPVVGAKVKAYVTTPHNTNKPVELDLEDNGQGADVQKGDGTYSKFFTSMSSKGRYNVKAQVLGDENTFINNGKFSVNPRRTTRSTFFDIHSVPHNAFGGPIFCCGSGVPFDIKTATHTGIFVRIAEAGSFQVIVASPSGDYLPPVRVRDLQLILVNADHINLTWTAPGDDLDSGIVSGYEIIMSTNRSQLEDGSFDASGNETLTIDLNDSTNDTDDLLVEAGETVTVLVNLKQQALEKGKIYYCALRAADDGNRKSDVSNLVILWIPLIPLIPSEVVTENIWEKTWFQAVIITLLILTLLLVILCIVGTIRCMCKRKDEEEDSEHSPLRIRN